MTRRSGIEAWPVSVVVDGVRQELPDPVVVEEPLEIRAAPAGAGEPVPLTVTLRTPGDDVELAAGLLYAEGLIESAKDLAEIREVRDPDQPRANRVDVRLREGLELDPRQTARSFASTAACGVCGKVAIDAIFVKGLPEIAPDRPRIARELLESLPARMRSAQEIFSSTGGLHGAALFDAEGELLLVREDVGRHNAVDKLVGSMLLEDRLPAREAVLVVSGRAGFEITQKALRAGIGVLAAVGAPSSLSLRLAERGGLTLVGFLRPGRFNLYTAPQRVVG